MEEELGRVEEVGVDPAVIEHEVGLRTFPVIKLRYAEERSEAFALLDGLHQTLLGVLGIALLALIAGVVLAGRLVAAPIYTITRELESRERRPGEQVLLSVVGVEEVDRLVRAHNQLQHANDDLNQALRAQYMLSHQVFDAMADALVVTDEGGQVVEVNPAAIRLLQRESEWLTGRSVDELLQLEEDQDGSVTTAAGEVVPVHSSSSLLEDSRHRIYLLHDLRERLRAEQQEQYGAFQAGIAEMAGTVLHNIGNALTGMQGDIRAIRNQTGMLDQLVEVLENRSLVTEETAGERVEPISRGEVVRQSAVMLRMLGGEEKGIPRALQQLEGAIEHIEEVISLQQRVARPTRDLSRFSLRELLDSVAGMIEDTLRHSNIELVISLEGELPRLELPRNPLIQLLLNLTSNSMEAILNQRRSAPEQLGRIEFFAVMPEDGKVELQLRDNGCGVEPERLKGLFHARSRGEHRGQGLHAAGNFLSSIGGTIALESPGRGHGMVVRIGLPLTIQRRSASVAGTSPGDEGEEERV